MEYLTNTIDHAYDPTDDIIDRIDEERAIEKAAAELEIGYYALLEDLAMSPNEITF